MTATTPKTRRFLKIITLAIATGVSGGLFAGDDDHVEVLPPVDNAKWRNECASCHQLYHPALLPERSWRKMMSSLNQHFGENAKLDAASQKEITEFLVAHAADHSMNRRAQKIARSVPAGEAPLRATETAYFIHKHNEIRSDIWQRKSVGSKANCKACHPGAEKDNFDEKAISIPR